MFWDMKKGVANPKQQQTNIWARVELKTTGWLGFELVPSLHAPLQKNIAKNLLSKSSSKDGSKAKKIRDKVCNCWMNKNFFYKKKRKNKNKINF
jgi:hypothetical protein